MSGPVPQPRFLTLDEILVLHELSLRQYGGDSGIHDEAMLRSAIAQPEAGIATGYLHVFPLEMAAAYGFHIAKGHAFIDGNKRTAWLAMQLFLELNGHSLAVPLRDGADAMIAVADGSLNKTAFTQWIASRVQRHPT